MPPCAPPPEAPRQRPALPFLCRRAGASFLARPSARHALRRRREPAGCAPSRASPRWQTGPRSWPSAPAATSWRSAPPRRLAGSRAPPAGRRPRRRCRSTALQRRALSPAPLRRSTARFPSQQRALAQTIPPALSSDFPLPCCLPSHYASRRRCSGRCWRRWRGSTSGGSRSGRRSRRGRGRGRAAAAAAGAEEERRLLVRLGGARRRELPPEGRWRRQGRRGRRGQPEPAAQLGRLRRVRGD